MILFRIILFIILLPLGIKAQNLVSNGSFEVYDSIHTNIGGITHGKVDNWFALYTSDLYGLNPIPNFMRVPRNAVGYQFARTGVSYAGFQTGHYIDNSFVNCEDLQSTLLKPLEIGKCYNYRFYISLADESMIATDRIFISFFDTNFTVSQPGFNNLKEVNQIGLHYTDTQNWVEIRGAFIPTHPVNTLIIYSPDSQIYTGNQIKTPYFVIKNNSFIGDYQSYYFIDDVAVWPCDTVPPSSNAGPDRKICWGDSVLIGGHHYNDYSYRWKPLNGEFNPMQYDSGLVYVSPKYTTDYVVEATDFKFDKTYDTVRVEVELCDLEGQEIWVCEGSSTQLNAGNSDNLHHNWEPALFLDSSAIQSPVCTPPTDIGYIHTAVDSLGQIVQEDTFVVRLKDCRPAINDTIICLGESLIIGRGIGNYISYSWNPFDYLDNATIAQPIATPVKSMIYSVIAIDSAGNQKRDTIQIKVELCDLPPEVEVPNVLTPNGDGMNDRLEIRNSEFWKLDLTIYNRWGQEVYHGDNQNLWDCIYKGERVSEGVYFFYLTAVVEGYPESFRNYRGNITVMYER